MSFLDSVLSSIETGKPAAIPPAKSHKPEPPISSSTAKSEVRKPSTVSRNARENKPSTAGIKRKAEEQLHRVPKPDDPASNKPVSTNPSATPGAQKPRPVPANAGKPSSSSKAPTPLKSAPAAPASSKPPPPGSFADIMMKAKNLQQNAPTQVGTFKHQAAPKERISKMERKRRAAEAQVKEKDPRLAKKSGAAVAGAKVGDGKFARKRDSDEPTYKGTARPTQTPTVPEYRGTAGLPAKRRSNDARQQSRAGRKSRTDDYLGTDEEDEGDYADGYDDYYSESSDMEAGLDDVEGEEELALKAARREDEEEWQAELAAKKEKLEHKKKLASLASRAR